MRRTYFIIGASLLIVSAVFPACGSSDSPDSTPVGTGGSSDASVDGTAGKGGASGGGAGSAGKHSGGSAGGVTKGGSAGTAQGGGGSAGTAGSGMGGAAGDGGSATGGSAGDGGSATGGSAGDGGSATGGSAGDGGSATGGSAGDGGSATGGSGGAGGSATGGAAGTGGSAGSSPSPQIIADHTIVARYDVIPQTYIDAVKKMWINIPGESHSAAYRQGLVALGQSDARFPAVATENGAPEAYTDQHLRVSRSVRNQYNNWSYGTGEAGWYTWNAHPLSSQPAAKDLIKNHITYCENNNLHIAAIGFGWCWDTTWHNVPGGTVDPVHGVRWAGASEGGPDGDLRWGLDDDDIPLTGNRVTMNTYLSATQAYIDFAAQQGFGTKVVFTTGPVDGYTGESGYQRHLKHEHIRTYVKGDSTRILFDYADILCWDDNATAPNTTTWSGHTYPIITTTNAGSGNVGHIGDAGALRLGKAMWWMLARIAGWDGN
ncbi:MAG: hypothetical protein HY898_30290 [Deltaproteobacteria bacterium]|nr:hypothetical protein [Deltaproteobacteria bacterium]